MSELSELTKEQTITSCALSQKTSEETTCGSMQKNSSNQTSKNATTYWESLCKINEQKQKIREIPNSLPELKFVFPMVYNDRTQQFKPRYEQEISDDSHVSLFQLREFTTKQIKKKKSQTSKINSQKRKISQS
jgi:hypothetical protein